MVRIEVWNKWLRHSMRCNDETWAAAGCLLARRLYTNDMIFYVPGYAHEFSLVNMYVLFSMSPCCTLCVSNSFITASFLLLLRFHFVSMGAASCLQSIWQMTFVRAIEWNVVIVKWHLMSKWRFCRWMPSIHCLHMVCIVCTYVHQL